MNNQKPTFNPFAILLGCTFVLVAILLLTSNRVNLPSYSDLGAARNSTNENGISGMLKSDVLTTLFAESEFNKAYPNAEVVINGSNLSVRSPGCEFDSVFHEKSDYAVSIKVVDSWFEPNVFFRAGLMKKCL